MEFLKFKLLEGDSRINHFITTRARGVSTGRYSSLNLSLKVGDYAEKVLENRKRIADSLGIVMANLLFPEQRHTDRVKEVAKLDFPLDLSSTDGLVTRERGVCLCILAADCGRFASGIMLT
jgi:copper oxidase (laccase) domain-containing protein